MPCHVQEGGSDIDGGQIYLYLRPSEIKVQPHSIPTLTSTTMRPSKAFSMIIASVLLVHPVNAGLIAYGICQTGKYFFLCFVLSTIT